MNMQAPITANTRRLKLVMLHNEPETEMGLQCTKPFLCSFYAYCTRLLPEDHNPETNLSDEPIIQHEAIREYVQAVAYPIGFLDFETIMPAVPLLIKADPISNWYFNTVCIANSMQMSPSYIQNVWPNQMATQDHNWSHPWLSKPKIYKRYLCTIFLLNEVASTRWLSTFPNMPKI